MKFIPRILLCGDKEEFFSRVGQRLFNFIGQIKFFDEESELDFLRDKKFLLNDELIAEDKLRDILWGRADFIIFNDHRELSLVIDSLYKLNCPRSQFMTLLEFNNLPTDGFYDMHSANQLLFTLKNLSVKTLLDVNAYFVKSYLMSKSVNDALEIDCIWQGDLMPIKENIFNHVYKTFSDCALRHYDAALILDIAPQNFDETFSRLSKSVEFVITFVRQGSALEKHIQDKTDTFKSVNVLPTFAGFWVFCQVKRPPEDFAIYIVTHKALPPEYVKDIPDYYKIIHAGRVLGEDLGYLGDDTGDNISDLNPYINEITALYWMWKNTSHTIIGLSHYRRLFTVSGQNFLADIEVADILRNYDIITGDFLFNTAPSYESMDNIVHDRELATFATCVMRKNLMRTHPDYLDAFDYKMKTPTLYHKNMFVTRRPVFDAYCEWLFSFMIDSTREVLDKTPLAELSFQKRRLMGHFAERMLTVWLMKNRLRIKEVAITELSGL